ncbi:MAG: DUF4397 domain-containing protein [Chloroflexi bacterium]|nr:DUF4397 domain-containing protein [Chloroflexota bacterium]
MTVTRKIASLLILFLSAAMFSGVSLGQTMSRARVIHVASGSPAMDIYLNGELAVADLSYGEDSAYFSLPGGQALLRATVAGTTAQLLEQSISLETEATTLVLSSTADLQVDVLAEDLSPLEFGLSRLLIVNALREGSAVDISAVQNEGLAVENLAPGSAHGPIELPAAAIEFSVRSSDNDAGAVQRDFSVSAAAGTSGLLVIHGTIRDPQMHSAAAAVDGEARSGRVRFAHAVQGAASVDLKINGTMIIPALAFASPSEHIALPSGAHQLTLSLAGTVISSLPLVVGAEQLQTVAVMGSPANLNVFSYKDSLRDLNASAAVVNLINAVPQSVVSRLRLDSGAIVAADVRYGETGGPARIAPGKQALSMILQIGEDRGTVDVPPTHFYAGAYYNLIALAGSAFSAPSLLIVETSLLRGVGAASPSMESAVADKDEPTIEEQPSAPEETDAAAQSIKAAAVEAPADSAAEVEPDALGAEDPPEQTAPADEDPPDKPEAPAEIGLPIVAISPYAVVDLAPSARLHLREYPSSDALSLGLLPGASNLIVLGRRGPSEFYPDDAPELPLDLSEYRTDPAAALYPAQDLAPADTWLFVVYYGADGGAHTGWVNAHYLQVYDETGAEQRLASLPMVRQNRAGANSNSDMQPPSLADSVSARVWGLNPGAMLNMRMANDLGSEAITLLPPEAELRLIGLDANEDWVYADYHNNVDQIIRGWVSAAYVQLLLNEEPVQLGTLRALDETVAPTVSDLMRGSKRSAEGAGPTPIPPTDDMMKGIVGEVRLDPGAMLHLRRQPSINAESLAGIPAGAKVPISGITQSGEWLKTSYEDQDGWIAARYVTLLLRGRFYHRSYIEGSLPLHDNVGNPTG